MIRQAISILLVMGALISAAMFLALYWQHRNCFNGEGRCFDLSSGVVYHEQSFMWGPIGVALVVAGMAVALSGSWHQR